LYAQFKGEVEMLEEEEGGDCGLLCWVKERKRECREESEKEKERLSIIHSILHFLIFFIFLKFSTSLQQFPVHHLIHPPPPCISTSPLISTLSCYKILYSIYNKYM